MNVIWQTWLAWHVANGSRKILADWLESAKAWHKADEKTRGAKPKLTLQRLPKELAKQINAAVKAACPTIHIRTQTLIVKRWGDTLGTRKAASGNLSGWMAILLSRESIPSSTRPQPIKFDLQSAKLLAPLEKGGKFRLSLRLDRLDKPGSKMAGSTVDLVELNCKPKHHGQYAILCGIIEGKYKFHGSELCWQESCRKWIVHVSWSHVAEQETPRPPGSKVATLHPGRENPFNLWLDGYPMQIGGTGRAIGSQRERLLTNRWSRQENYRFAQRSGKGHGRKRALLPVDKLSRVWRNFTTTYNHTITREIIKRCVDRGVGKLIILQPMGDKAARRYCTTAGKIEGRRDSTGWTWFQIATMAKYKAEEHGIEIEVRQCGESSDSPVPSVRDSDPQPSKRSSTKAAQTV